jgi:hypothetical protein
MLIVSDHPAGVESMKKLTKTTYFAGDRFWLEREGDKCWEFICDHAPVGEWFAVRPIVEAWAKHTGKSGYTTYARAQIIAVLANVLAQGDGQLERTL